MERANYIEFNHLNIPYLIFNNCLIEVDNNLKSFGIDYICDMSNSMKKLMIDSNKLTKSQLVDVIKTYINLFEKYAIEYMNETLKPQIHIRKLERRINHVINMPSVFSPEIITQNSEILSSSLKSYVNRHVANHLLLFGYRTSAIALANKYNIQDFLEIDVYDLIEYFNRLFDSRNIKPCLKWIKNNHTNLQYLHNYNITYVLLQMTNFCEILKTKTAEEALMFLKRNITPKSNPNVNHILKEAVKMVIMHHQGKCYNTHYNFDTDSIWDYLKSLVMNLVLQFFNLNNYSNLQLLIQTGLSSYKTLNCVEDDSNICPCCDQHVKDIVTNLPATKYSKSIILCPITNKLIDNDDYTILLPCGQMCSQKGFVSCKNDEGSGKFLCPFETSEYHEYSEIRRIYF